MKKMLTFARRCTKELLRDPLSLIFSVGLPLVLLFIMTAIRNATGVDIFPLEDFAPATAVFAQTFIAMFTGILVSQDRCSAYLTRLFASPLTARDFILGYSLPLIPMSIVQGALCLGVSLLLGLKWTPALLAALPVLLPSAVLFIGMGILLGCLLKETQVGGVASIIVQVAAFTSGMWFDVELIGGAFLSLARILPFYHAVEAVRAAAAGQWNSLFPALFIVCGWAVLFFAAAIIVFQRKMMSDGK